MFSYSCTPFTYERVESRLETVDVCRPDDEVEPKDNIERECENDFDCGFSIFKMRWGFL